MFSRRCYPHSLFSHRQLGTPLLAFRLCRITFQAACLQQLCSYCPTLHAKPPLLDLLTVPTTTLTFLGCIDWLYDAMQVMLERVCLLTCQHSRFCNEKSPNVHTHRTHNSPELHETKDKVFENIGIKETIKSSPEPTCFPP